MSVSITSLANELQELTRWQVTPEIMTDEDYNNLIIRGIKKLFVDLNRDGEYSDDLITYNVYGDYIFDKDLNLREKEYVLLCAQIGFYKQVQADVNNRFSYSTDALKVTNADKPYANIKDTIANLDNERRIVYYKMVDYTLG